MAKSTSSAERRMLVDKCLTDLSLLAKRLCPEARIEATMECYEKAFLSAPQCMTRNGSALFAWTYNADSHRIGL